MTGMYWYISRQKVDALREAYGSSRLNRLKDPSLKLKVPFAEASFALNLDQSLYQAVERISVNLRKAPETSCFPNLYDDGPITFFSFEGRARRCIDADAYWIALFADTTALLLAGSISNAIGGPATISGNAISPTADPIRAVQLAFAENRSPKETETVGASCSYVWQTISDPFRANWQSLPRVEGIAVYGGSFPARIANFGDSNSGEITEIVIGSPIYVRQQ